MIIRQLDTNGDWTYGQGKNNYITTNAAVIQDANTRLLEFQGDCFFNQGAGIDWFTFLGGKDQLSLNLAMAAILLNTENVTGVSQVSATLTNARNLAITYQAQSVYSTISSAFIYDLGAQ